VTIRERIGKLIIFAFHLEPVPILYFAAMPHAGTQHQWLSGVPSGNNRMRISPAADWTPNYPAKNGSPLLAEEKSACPCYRDEIGARAT
jgi:hypothetical protein